MSQGSGLDFLRQYTNVDCDALDPQLVQKYDPYHDCTANQAIALSQLRKPEGKEIWQEAMRWALDSWQSFPGVGTDILMVEFAMVLLSAQMVPYLRPDGYFHVQVNPDDAYNEDEMYKGAMRIVEMAKMVGLDEGRVCIKIPCTFAGVKVCRSLESHENVATLATTVFGLAQAAAAAGAGCRYIAPYMHGLKEVLQGQISTDPACIQEANRIRSVVVNIQLAYDKHKYETKVLAAALMTADECLRLRDVHHMTLAPPILYGLASMDAASAATVPSAFDVEKARKPDINREERKEGMPTIGEAMMESAAQFQRWINTVDGPNAQILLAQALEEFGRCQKALVEEARGFLTTNAKRDAMGLA